MNKPRSRLLAYERLMDLAQGLQATLIMTPDPLSINQDATVGEALALLEQHNFDQLLVTENGDGIGILRKEIITDQTAGENIKGLFESITYKNALPEDTPIGHVLELLVDQPSCLVLGQHDQVVGLVHISDLNRHPVRLYFYLLISAAEMGLTELIRREDPAESWIHMLPDKKRAVIQNNYCQQMGKHVELTRLSLVGFPDLVLILKSRPNLWQSLIKDLNEERILTSIQEPRNRENPRNQVMHLNKTMVSVQGDVARHNDTARFLIRFLRRLETMLVVNPVNPVNTASDGPRSLSALTERWAVEMAIAEYDCLKRDGFLKKYGFGKAKSYFILEAGREYDSKAIVGAAFGFQHPHLGPLNSSDFNGGESTVKHKLEELGFVVIVKDY